MVIQSRPYGRHYFKTKSGIYYFRLVVSDRYRKIKPELPKEIRRSLYTRKHHVARIKAAEHLVQSLTELRLMQDNIYTVAEFLTFISGKILWDGQLPANHQDKLTTHLIDQVAAHKELLESAQIADYVSTSATVTELQARLDDIIRENLEDNFRRADSLLSEVVQLTAQLIADVRRQTSGPSLADAMAGNRNVKNKALPDTSLETLVGKYVGENQRAGNWTEKTTTDYQTALSTFIEYLSKDYDITQLDKPVIRNYKELLQKLPKNRNKVKQYRDKSFAELTAIDIPLQDRLSIENINKHLTRLSAFTNWCVDQGYITSNPVSGMKIRASKKAIEKRLPFSASDLNALFSDPIFTDSKFKKPYQYWLPLLGLYTGARVQELCQLYVDDIDTIDNIPVIHITDERPDQKLKNEGSKRTVPIHQQLLDLGFLAFVAMRKKQKQDRLFPELDNERDGYSQAASKWFTRFKGKHGFEGNSKKVFHSFRHTFIDGLKNLSTEEYLVAALVGHVHEKMTYGQYGGTTKIELLNTTIQKLEYRDFDVDGIKRERW